MAETVDDAVSGRDLGLVSASEILLDLAGLEVGLSLESSVMAMEGIPDIAIDGISGKLMVGILGIWLVA